jgi:hypothetical protein
MSKGSSCLVQWAPGSLYATLPAIPAAQFAATQRNWEPLFTKIKVQSPVEGMELNWM